MISENRLNGNIYFKTLQFNQLDVVHLPNKVFKLNVTGMEWSKGEVIPLQASSMYGRKAGNNTANSVSAV